MINTNMINTNIKYVLIFLILILVPVNAYSIWDARNSQQLLDEANLILVGTILSIIDKTPADEYTIQIEEYVKGSLPHDVIKLKQPILSIPYGTSGIGNFSVGDRVLFYVDDIYGEQSFAPESFIIPHQCVPKKVINKPRLDNFSFTITQNNSNNYVANEPLHFNFSADMGDLSGFFYDLHVNMMKTDGKNTNKPVFNMTFPVESQPCNWVSSKNWIVIPQEGQYVISLKIIKENTTTQFSKLIYVAENIIQPPLKQLQQGILFNEIQCKQNLVLIQKYDGMPACVTEPTKQKLIEREWTR